MYQYYIFIDESGDHGLVNIDENFPVFVLCGVVFSENNYNNFIQNLNEFKMKYFNSSKVILHSRDIRKCNNEFSILFDLNLKESFYKDLNLIIQTSKFVIISSIIDKKNIIKTYGKLVADIYELSLSFILERTVFSFDSNNETNIQLKIILESRGRKEDEQLRIHFQKLLSRGTSFIEPTRFKKYNITIEFKSKILNDEGLQLADLMAYPIARDYLNPTGVNESYKIVENKYYRKGDKIFGRKVFP